jgi:hypothetical protein
MAMEVQSLQNGLDFRNVDEVLLFKNELSDINQKFDRAVSWWNCLMKKKIQNSNIS